MIALLLFSVASSLALAPPQDAKAAAPASLAERASTSSPPAAPPATAEDHIPMSHGNEAGTLSGRPQSKPILVLHRSAAPAPQTPTPDAAAPPVAPH